MNAEDLDNPNISNDWWGALPESVKQQINEGLKDCEEGRVMSSEEFWKRLKAE